MIFIKFTYKLGKIFPLFNLMEKYMPIETQFEKAFHKI